MCVCDMSDVYDRDVMLANSTTVAIVAIAAVALSLILAKPNTRTRAEVLLLLYQLSLGTCSGDNNSATTKDRNNVKMGEPYSSLLEAHEDQNL